MAGFLSTPGTGFFDKLAARADKIDSLLCVGLDPHAQDLNGENNAAGAKAFCLRLIKATSSVALAFKPNAAFFESFGVSHMNENNLYFDFLSVVDRMVIAVGFRPACCRAAVMLMPGGALIF